MGESSDFIWLCAMEWLDETHVKDIVNVCVGPELPMGPTALNGLA